MGEESIPAESTVLVTHNIEEAVLLADRIIILGANPGVIRGELHIDLARPREKLDFRFKALVDHVYMVMTHPQAKVAVLANRKDCFGLLPHARAGGISGFLEILDERGGGENLPALAKDLHLHIDDFMPTVDAAALLGFVTVAKGDVSLSSTGREFAQAEVHRSHHLFREQLLEHVPLMSIVLALLKSKKGGQVHQEFVLDILDEHFSAAEAARQLEALIDWARYAHLIDYDATQERLSLVAERE